LVTAVGDAFKCGKKQIARQRTRYKDMKARGQKACAGEAGEAAQEIIFHVDLARDLVGIVFLLAWGARSARRPSWVFLLKRVDNAVGKKPTLHMPLPLSTTRACTSSSSDCQAWGEGRQQEINDARG
jgi:hypothetical protein